MHFVAEQRVTIGGKVIDTVHSIKTKYDSTHVGASCEIVVPLNCVIEYQNSGMGFLTAYALDLFKAGDLVTVDAWYIDESGTNMGVVSLFRGYVFDFKMGMPLTIKCIDYLPLLGHNKTISNYTGSLKNLIESILVGTGVSLILPTLDLHLVKWSCKTVSPWGILEYFKKSIGINITLFGDKLYMNVASNTLTSVRFDSRINVYQNDLQIPDAVWQGYKVKAWFIQNNGTRSSLEVGDPEGHCTDVYFYKVAGGEPVYKRLADEALTKLRQRKYSGNVGALLYPVVGLYDKITYTDFRYPEKNGNYVVTSIAHTFDDNGILVSMRWAFLTDFINAVSQ